MVPALVLRQNVSTAETRAVAQACLLSDIPCRVAALDGLAGHAEALKAGALPVGSVEFVRAAMGFAGIAEPVNLSYPKALRPMLGRELRRARAGTVLGTWFVKPVTTKAFTGFVFDTMRAPEDYDAHDREQYDAFMALPHDTEVWMSEPVRFRSEWRYYVCAREVLGSSRYDADGADDAPAPDEAFLHDAVRLMAASAGPAAYAIDLGVLDSGETVLVEVNDAWALGLYGRAVEPRRYLDLLATRWSELVHSFSSQPAAARRIKP